MNYFGDKIISCLSSRVLAVSLIIGRRLGRLEWRIANVVTGLLITCYQVGQTGVFSFISQKTLPIFSRMLVVVGDKGLLVI